jgi:hypothetical protein
VVWVDTRRWEGNMHSVRVWGRVGERAVEIVFQTPLDFPSWACEGQWAC